VYGENPGGKKGKGEMGAGRMAKWRRKAQGGSWKSNEAGALCKLKLHLIISPANFHCSTRKKYQVMKKEEKGWEGNG